MEGEDFDGLLASLSRWAAGQRAEEAAGARSRVRWLRQQAAEAAALAGVLLDLAERSAEVTVETAGGRHEGRVEVVTTGLCGLRQADQGVTLIALPAVTAIRLHGGGALGGGEFVATGDRTPPVQLDMAGALTALSADRSEVVVELAGGAQLTGVLGTVGIELVSLQLGDGTAAMALVVLDAITACAVLSGFER